MEDKLKNELKNKIEYILNFSKNNNIELNNPETPTYSPELNNPETPTNSPELNNPETTTNSPELNNPETTTNEKNNIFLQEEVKKKIIEILSFKPESKSVNIDNNDSLLETIKEIIRNKLNSNIMPDIINSKDNSNQNNINHDLNNQLVLYNNNVNENNDLNNQLVLYNNRNIPLIDYDNNDIVNNEKNLLLSSNPTTENILVNQHPELQEPIFSNKKEDINIIYKEASNKNPTNFYLISSLKTAQEYKNIRDKWQSISKQ
jgi:hypothetical protein